MPDVPQRIKVADGYIVPAYPEECEPHTPSPRSYPAWFDWFGEMEQTHTQTQCRGCGLWAVWVPKPGATSEGQPG